MLYRGVSEVLPNSRTFVWQVLQTSKAHGAGAPKEASRIQAATRLRRRRPSPQNEVSRRLNSEGCS